MFDSAEKPSVCSVLGACPRRFPDAAGIAMLFRRPRSQRVRGVFYGGIECHVLPVHMRGQPPVIVVLHRFGGQAVSFCVGVQRIPAQVRVVLLIERAIQVGQVQEA